MKVRFASFLGLFVGLLLLAGPGVLYAQSPSCKVLDLDGNESCVELPGHLFTNDVITVEGWVKWRSFGSYSRFFEFSDAALRVGVLNEVLAPDLTFQRVLTPEYAGQSLSAARGNTSQSLSGRSCRHT